MNDKIVQDWLSRKTSKSVESERAEGKDYYTQEQADREKNQVDIGGVINTLFDKQGPPSESELFVLTRSAFYASTDSPYNRSYVEPIDLEMMVMCLHQMRTTNKPLPIMVTDAILRDIQLLQSSIEGDIFQRKKGHPKTHPDDSHIQRMVVEYAALAEEWDLDDDPKKTLELEFGIKRSTYYSWRKSFHDAEWISMLADNKGEAKKKIREIYDALLMHFDPPE